MRWPFCTLLVVSAGVVAVPTVGVADVVTDWNATLIDVTRIVGGAPGPISRAGAMLHVAQFDAMNAVDRTHTPYAFHGVAPAGADKSAAAAQAAYDVLSTLYPTYQALFDTRLATSLALVPDGDAKSAGRALGSASASAILTQRQTDGANSPVVYVPGTNPGDWRPSDPGLRAATPHWGNVTPFTLTRGDQFRPNLPWGYPSMSDLLASPQYAADLNEVKQYGGRDDTTRTSWQNDIARFWANDRDGTCKPPGHLNLVTMTVAEQVGLSPEQNARLFALTNLAMADAGVASWDAKYNTDIDLWRPVDAIRLADTDGNSLTVADPDWVPLSYDFNGWTPPFPAWVSGHATFGAAHAAAIAAFFGTDEMTFTLTAAEGDDMAGMSIPYDRFSDAAWDNALSRIYLGVHYRVDATDGYQLGTNVGTWAAATQLLPIPEPTGVAISGIGIIGLINRRRAVLRT